MTVATMTDARRFSKILRGFARIPSQATTAIAREISKEIQKNFDQGVDPYGRKWRPLSRAYMEATGRTNPPLTDTGRGRRSVKVAPLSGAGLTITIGVLYMVYHQFGGASHLRGPGGSYRRRKQNKNFGRDKDRSGGRENPPKRSFLPFDRMPARWEQIIQKQLEKMTARMLKRV